MTIYTSTTLAELLDELDMRAPDLAAPIRERVEELEDERDDLQQELDAVEDDVNALGVELADSREQCAALLAAGGAS